jgi:hypothetical protein
MFELAEHAIDEVCVLADKRSMGSPKTIAERAPIQAALARARASVGQARSYLHAMTRDACTRSHRPLLSRGRGRRGLS